MSSLTRRLSVSELRDRILTMAITGVYRQSLFEAFQPVATQQQIRSAITQAKGLGLKSVAALRDSELGTYYQLDKARYEMLQSVSKASFHPSKGDDGVQQAIAASQAIQTMLSLAGGMTLILAIAAGYNCLAGHSTASSVTAMTALFTGVLWRLQHWVAHRHAP
ncbi:MAG: hypothetical protein AAF215_03295 [Cyanobacteria bacterium P01_A01_bin.123]